jgi:nitrite reductase/ring-hydroxylating ferredoxin subunit
MRNLGGNDNLSDWKRVCSVLEVPPGQMKTFIVNDERVLISNLDGEIHAVEGTCTHEEADLGTGFLLGNEVTCPLHLSRFDLKSGEVLSPPATEPLRVFNLKVENSDVFVEVP